MSELFFFLLLVFLPTQLGLHFWPSWALVLGRRIDYLSPTLYFTDIIVFFILFFWIVKLIQTKRNINFKFSPHTVFFIASLIFIFCNIFFAANRMVAVFAWMKILEFVALGIYIIKTKPKFSSLLFPLSVGVFYSSVIAITQFCLQHSIGGVFWFLGERTFSVMTPGIAQVPVCYFHQTNCPLLLRAYATFSHPNVLGGYLAVLLPLIIFNFQFSIFNKTKKLFIFNVITIILGIIALGLTFSRSAWVVFVIEIILALVVAKKKKFFIPAVIIGIGMFFIIGSTLHLSDESVIVREQLNAAAISMIRASPIIGSGAGNFLIQLPQYLVSRQIYFLQPVHTIYLLIFSETGIIGLAIFLWICWNALKQKTYRVSLAACLLLGFVDHYFLTLQQGQLLFTVILSLSLIQ
jgi:hypothetical protein